MPDEDSHTMWQGVLTETYIDKEKMPGRELLISSSKVGSAHPDPNAAWRDALEFLEKHKKRKVSNVFICIKPAGYMQDEVEEKNGPDQPKTLN